MEERSVLAPKLLYNVIEVAAVLGIGRSKLYSYILSGQIRSLKLGRRRLITPEAIQAFLHELQAIPDQEVE